MSSSVTRRIRRMSPKAKAQAIARMMPAIYCPICCKTHPPDMPQCPLRLTPGHGKHRV